MSRRDDALYLDDIVEASRHIEEFLQGVDKSAFHASELDRCLYGVPSNITWY